MEAAIRKEEKLICGNWKKSIAQEISFADNEVSPSRHNISDKNQESDDAVNIRNKNKTAPRKEPIRMHSIKGKVKSKLSTISSSESETNEDMSLQDSSSGLEDFDDYYPTKEDEFKKMKDWKPVQKVIHKFVVFRYEEKPFPGQIQSFNDKRVTIMAMESGIKSWK